MFNIGAAHINAVSCSVLVLSSCSILALPTLKQHHVQYWCCQDQCRIVFSTGASIMFSIGAAHINAESCSVLVLASCSVLVLPTSMQNRVQYWCCPHQCSVMFSTGAAHINAASCLVLVLPTLMQHHVQ